MSGEAWRMEALLNTNSPYTWQVQRALTAAESVWTAIHKEGPLARACMIRTGYPKKNVGQYLGDAPAKPP